VKIQGLEEGKIKMEFKRAERLNHFQTGIFAALDEKKSELIKARLNSILIFPSTNPCIFTL
jgi:hypothetical protein